MDPLTTLAQNLEALQPAAARQAIAGAPPGGWQVDWRTPWPVLAFESAPGQWQALNGSDTPIEDAAAALAARRGDAPWPPTVVLLGAGLGYAIDAIEREAPEGTRILAIEPFAASAMAMLARRDWRPLLESGRLRILVGPQYLGAADAWRMFPAGDAAPLLLPERALLPSHAHDVLAARRLFDRIYLDANANAEARRKLGGRYLVNTLANLPRLLDAPDLRTFVGSRQGQPAVVCGAGPSLNRNLEALRPYRDRVVVVAADTALRPMLSAGIEPDFVVALDPSPVNARHLSTLPRLERTWLVSEAALDPSAFAPFGDRVTFFRVGNNDPWPWLRQLGLDAPVLAAWGSVLTSTFELTTWLGCDPVAFIGADLAFTGSATYARGTTYELEWARIVLEGLPLPVYFERHLRAASAVDEQGVAGPVPTTKHLIAFRDWLVERVAGAPRRIVNLTGDGVLVGPGIEQHDASWFETLAAPSSPTPPTEVGARPPAAVDRRAIAAAAASVARDAEPMAGWFVRCAGNLDDIALRNALEAIARCGQVTRTAIPTPVDRSRDDDGVRHPALSIAGLPEAIAILRAAREGRPAPDWAMSSPIWSRRQAPTAAPAERLRAVMANGPLMASGKRATAVPAVPGHLQNMFTLDWRPAAIEAMAALAVDAGAIVRETGSGPRLIQRHRPAGTGARADGDARAGRRRAERKARLLALATAATAAVAADPENAGLHQWLDVCGAAQTALEDEDRQVDGVGTLAVAGARRASPAEWKLAFPLTTTRRADVLRGGLFAVRRTRGGPRAACALGDLNVAFEASRRNGTSGLGPAGLDLVDWLATRILTPAGRPNYLTAAAVDDRRVLVAPRGERTSILIDASGAITANPEWPEAIASEVPAPSGHVAWTDGSPGTLFYRDAATRRVVTTPAPFHAYTGLWWRERAVITSDKGIWTWRPGDEPRLLCDLPPCTPIDIRDGWLAVDPLPLRDGRMQRFVFDTAWEVELETGTTRQRALGPEGQRWSVVARNGTVVTTFPDADLVRIEVPDVEALWLAWPRPRTAAWLDGTLFLNSADGHVVLFTDLAARLDRFRAAVAHAPVA